MTSKAGGVERSPRALLHLLYNGAKAVDVLTASLELGLLDSLEGPEPITLAQLAARHGLVPGRLYKLLDCLESLGLVTREQDTDALASARYHAVEGLRDATLAVLGPKGRETDREKFAWRTLHGRLPEVLRGQHSIAPADFDWPLRTPEQLEGFETSMAAGLPPILEALRLHAPELWKDGQRVLDVGGGDGSLAAHLSEEHPGLKVDVFNLPATRPLVERTRERFGLAPSRLGFVAGDFLKEPLPTGYDVMSFVRVLHDWAPQTAQALLQAAWTALPSGGRVIICEEFRTPERLAAQFFWTYFLIGVDSCVSRLREVELYERMLTQAGFHRVHVLSGGPFELVTAQKP
ncbi:Ubiquinone/menaquinone biosynthesis C-methylase UbiE [Myxococcus fulvus]|uniref:Ubiquinone/menaquinone biosynthesis C-methylase UbiE n=1 Tax=Myxococcus fulvus TaxID=33 RepID=A0ABY1BWR3_MYXFU|nr:methyltransferase [Myxococcus fulvus]SES93542.1 Ubiquinone/menaquinone biosynthesis C-methylase UbiE [Myxococcus fulvus]